ncbi:aspartate kinase [Fructilactobacillus fructivorans]|uniref:aspartate kinase n=1 Tax=Fructilactobacillus fructivorans TaxID=1614 RepID=UPI0007049C58|nr:aspartate kinase [Fructilactobacillus fructivorans]KRN42728.1 aspartate kinase [Fructilactobacillus fructivorans]
MKVTKFGGSSLANGPQFQKVINIIKSDPDRRAIVVSAPGTRFKGDIKVTDLLIEYANQVINHEDFSDTLNQIIDRYQEIGRSFHVDEQQINQIVTQLNDLPNQSFSDTAHLMSTFKAQGEFLNVQMLTMILNQLEIPAKFMDPKQIGFKVTGNVEDAQINPATYENIRKFRDVKEKMVFPGFFGINDDNQIATFSRGGSDITGSIVARGLQADLYENFTDVNAIYSVDPRVVKNPKAIDVMTYREMRELSYAGFSVFHDEAIIPAIQVGIPINVKNTSAPDLPGTMIVPENKFQPTRVITGVASAKHFSALYIHRYLLNKQVGFTLTILKILYKYGVSYEHMPSGIDDLTIIFDKSQLNDHIVKEITKEIKAALHPDQLRWINDYAIIMIVGEGMQSDNHTIEKIIRPLTDNGISIHMINEGASKISVMLGTDIKDSDKAVKLIYRNFFDNNRLIY